MRYSRFDEQRGDYEIFEDDATRPLNADLPVPKLAQKAGRVGVPATEAGRAIPATARRVGRSWSPQGMVATTKRSAMGSVAVSAAHPFWWSAAGALGGAALSRSDSALVGSIIGGGLGYLAFRATRG